MKVYSITATRETYSLEHKRISMTKALPIVRELAADGWVVTFTHVGEATRTPPPVSPPMSHPWKANASVPKFMRRKQ